MTHVVGKETIGKGLPSRIQSTSPNHEKMVFADPTLEWQLINSHGHQEFPHWAFPVWLQFP